MIERLGGRITSQRWQDDVKLGPHTLRNRARISLYSEQSLVTLFMCITANIRRSHSLLLVRYILK